MPSSLKYIVRRRSKNVSLGHMSLGNGDVPPGAGARRIRVRTFSCESTLADVHIGPHDRRPAHGTNRGGRDAAAGFREGRVAPDDVGIGAGIDDVANGLGGQLRDRGHHLVRGFRGARVHQYDAVRTDLRADVGARADNHVEVRPDLKDLERSRIALRERYDARRTQRDANDCGEWP